MIKWTAENYQAVIGIIAATLGVLAMICKLTKTPKDDAIVAKALRWLNLIPKAK